jgi:hypothetical protein
MAQVALQCVLIAVSMPKSIEKTLAVHLSDQRDAIAQHIEGMTIIFNASVDVPTQLMLKRLQEVIVQEIRKPSDNWA